MNVINIKRIGILTGGGDCPGLNAVIRAVAKTAITSHRLEVIGIEDGFLGLIENRMRRLGLDDVSNILTIGGTILGTNNRSDPSRYPVEVDGEIEFHDVMDRCVEHIRQGGIDALVIIGGDGTMTVGAKFVEKGITCIGVPKTIDNDLVGTDVTFGFGTAVDTSSEALDRIRTTAESHHRAMVVEVMGRNAGWIALHAGVASGADVILIPEIPFRLGKIAEYVLERSRRGKRFSILCVSEGAKVAGGEQIAKKIDPLSPEPVRLGGVGQYVAERLAEMTGLETRTTVLGHIQRGGTPTAADRVLATRFGAAAVDLLMGGGKGRLVVMEGRTLGDIDMLEVANKQRLVGVDDRLVKIARAVGTCFGD